MPQKPFEIFEEDFRKTAMDYLMFQHHTWPGIITMGVLALVWAIGEIWLSTADRSSK